MDAEMVLYGKKQLFMLIRVIYLQKASIEDYRAILQKDKEKGLVFQMPK